VLGQDFDLVGKEAIPMLRRFRRELLIIPETVGKAGDFLARGLIAAIENPDAPPLQGLEVPDTVELPPSNG
jgi:LacI family transcriptional regulator